MKKFLLGLITGFVLTGLSLVILFFSAMRLGDRKPSVAEGSTLVLRLSGAIPERAPVSIPLPFFESTAPLTIHEVWTVLRRAGQDKSIQAILLEPQNVGVGWAKLDEIRSGLLEFKKSGKPIYAYLRSPGTREYYLASVADRIYISPEDMIDMKGLRAEIMFFRNTLDKIGAQVEVFAVGRYKDFGDTYTRTTMSDATREVMNSVLDSLYGHLVDTLAQARKKKPEEIRASLDDGPFTAKQAKAAGFVDGLIFEDQVVAELAGKLKQKELKKAGARDYLRSLSPPSDAKKRIAFVVGEGNILRGGPDSGVDGDNLTAASFIRLLRSVGEDTSIDGVILRVDSPGGDAVASDEMLREVELLSKKKPLVVSMSDAAASGGYYISLSGDPIVAYPNTFTGSIGVVYGKLNLKGLYDKLGITKDRLTRGRNADIDSDYGPLTPAGRAKLESGLNEFYSGFVTKVAKARKRKFEEMEPLSQGRVWLGSQAKANGLVDELGGIDKAIELVKQKAKIAPGDKVRLVPYPSRRSVFDELFRTPAESAMETRLRQWLGNMDYQLWLDGGFMRVQPYRIDVR